MTGSPENRAAQNTAIWAVALRLGEFSYASLAAECHIPIERSTLLVRGWVRMRLAAFDHIGGHRRHVFKLLPAAQEVTLPANLTVAEPQASAEENLWRTAGTLVCFGARDLAFNSTTPGVEVTEDMAARFCQVLLKGGYLKVEKKAAFRRAGKSVISTPAKYRLIRKTGPVPPVERRVMAVWDANLGQYTHVAGAEA
ncbi:MAG: hypothetical protein IOC92_02630 [Rhodobacter sp.]|nr:hypothetical protein [Rhodobacter sp.]MCA3461905.1 hypothetical protein [Rhodobacter sp.]MCA3464501.1 hypothetical protein [Rhodobacter sp.]MCA3467481.1 hypothetical protein [Rhodobacter sp.]MCA3470622.1 hypothetical protein [Rhodobacter sp.]